MTSLMPLLRCRFLFQRGYTALIYASCGGHADIVTSLIQASAALNIQNEVVSSFSLSIIYPLICSVAKETDWTWERCVLNLREMCVWIFVSKFCAAEKNEHGEWFIHTCIIAILVYNFVMSKKWAILLTVTIAVWFVDYNDEWKVVQDYNPKLFNFHVFVQNSSPYLWCCK